MTPAQENRELRKALAESERKRAKVKRDLLKVYEQGKAQQDRWTKRYGYLLES